MAAPSYRLTGLLRQLRPTPASHATGGGDAGGDGGAKGVPKRPPTAAERALALAEDNAFTAGWPHNIPPPEYTVVPRFPTGDAAMVDYLDEHGCAPGVPR